MCLKSPLLLGQLGLLLSILSDISNMDLLCGTIFIFIRAI